MCWCYLHLCWYFHFSKQNNNRNNERSITSKESSKAGRSGWPSMGRHSSCWVASKTRRARANDQVVSLNLRQSGRQKMKRTINNNNNNNMLVEDDHLITYMKEEEDKNMIDAQQGLICLRHSGNECLRKQNVSDQYQNHYQTNIRPGSEQVPSTRCLLTSC